MTDNKKRRSIIKLIIGLVVVAAVIVMARLFNLQELFKSLLAWIEGAGHVGGLVFMAIGVLVLVGFVVLVLNIGRLTERRTKIQIAADAATYSGALVEANALSTIAWCNSAMAQCYYNIVQYGASECVAGTGAYLKFVQRFDGTSGHFSTE